VDRRLALLAPSQELPTPYSGLSSVFATGSALAGDYEAALVFVDVTPVIELNPLAKPGDTNPTNEFVLMDGLRVNDWIHLTTPLPAVDDDCQVTGVLHFRHGDSKLEPRSADDVACTPP